MADGASDPGPETRRAGWERLEIWVDAETSHAIQAVVQERGWDPAEGPRLLLATGLAYASGQRHLEAIQSGEMGGEDLNRMLARLMETEGRLAALRFKTYEAQVANRAWELSTGAIHNENRGLRGTVDRLREENAALQAENARLCALLPAEPEGLPDEAPPKAGPAVLRRLWCLLTGRARATAGSR